MHHLLLLIWFLHMPLLLLIILFHGLTPTISELFPGDTVIQAVFPNSALLRWVRCCVTAECPQSILRLNLCHSSQWFELHGPQWERTWELVYNRGLQYLEICLMDSKVGAGRHHKAGHWESRGNEELWCCGPHLVKGLKSKVVWNTMWGCTQKMLEAETAKLCPNTHSLFSFW